LFSLELDLHSETSFNVDLQVKFAKMCDPRCWNEILSSLLSVWLAQLVKSLAAYECALTHTVMGSIVGADGYHPFGVGKFVLTWVTG
jgi:hypothetical protein